MSVVTFQPLPSCSDLFLLLVTDHGSITLNYLSPQQTAYCDSTISQSSSLFHSSFNILTKCCVRAHVQAARRAPWQRRHRLPYPRTTSTCSCHRRRQGRESLSGACRPRRRFPPRRPPALPTAPIPPLRCPFPGARVLARRLDPTLRLPGRGARSRRWSSSGRRRLGTAAAPLRVRF